MGGKSGIEPERVCSLCWLVRAEKVSGRCQIKSLVGNHAQLSPVSLFSCQFREVRDPGVEPGYIRVYVRLVGSMKSRGVKRRRFFARSKYECPTTGLVPQDFSSTVTRGNWESKVHVGKAFCSDF